MASGLQVWDADGNLMVDLTTRLCKFLGTVTVGSGSAATGYVTVPEFTQNGNEGFFYRADGAYFDYSQRAAVFYIDGNRLYWQFPTSARPAQTVNYGVF